MKANTWSSRLAAALAVLLLLTVYPLGGPPQTVSADPLFELGKTPFYGKVPILNANSRISFWYGALDQTKLNQLKGYDLVILEPTLRVINVKNNEFYFENLTSAQVQELKRGSDGLLGTADDVIVLGYISIGEMLSTIIPGSSGHMTIQRGIELGLLPEGYSGPSGPLHGPNPWNFNSSGGYVNVEGGSLPDGTYDDGYQGYAGLGIADDYSSWGNRLTWKNQGVMPWYLDQQGTWVTDSRYMYGGYWKDGNGVVDVNNSYGGGYVNGGDPAWQKFVTFQVDKIVHDAKFDGVFLDTVDTPDPVGGAGPSVSWGPRGNFGFTAEGMVELVEAIKEVNPAKIVAANRGYWYFNPDEGTSQFADRYRHAINMFVTESWYYNAYIPGFYDEHSAYADNWNTNTASPSYRSRDNFGGFWKSYMNELANQPDGFNMIIIDFMIPSGGTNKWMNEIVTNNGYMGYDVSGSTHFNSAIYDTSKNWLDSNGLHDPSHAGAHPTDMHDGFLADGQFTEWSSETPIFSDPAGANSKGITKVYSKFVGDSFFMMIEANTTLNLSQEMIYFDYDQDGAEGWQVFWPTSPDARIYFENMNQVYALPHQGSGDVFRFGGANAPTNRGWPVRAVQSGNRAELEMSRDYLFSGAQHGGGEVWTWFRSANFGGQTVKFTVPTEGPAVSNVQAAAIGDNTATITWSTDLPSTSIVRYGVGSTGEASSTSSAQITQHSMTLTGLTPGTTYRYKVSSQDAQGRIGESGERIFATTNSTAPPVVSNITVQPIESGKATVRWESNQPATSQVQYGLTTAYGSTVNSSTLKTSHSVELNGLSPGTSYQFRIRSSNAGGLMTTSGNSSFTTLPLQNGPDITVDGHTSDWSTITALATGATTVQTIKAAYDETNLYLLAEGTGLNTMAQFYIDSDNNASTGYNATGWPSAGANYLLENNFLYRHNGSGWSWTSLGALSSYTKNGTAIEAAIPLATLGLAEGDTIRLGFLKNNSTTDRLPAPNVTLPSYTLIAGPPVPDSTPPATPTGLAATTGNGQAALSWNAVIASDLAGYHVYRGGTQLTSAPIPSTSYTATGLTNGTLYSFTVKAIDTSGNLSSASAAVTITPAASPPPATIIIDGNAAEWSVVPALATGSSTVQSMKAASDGTNLYLLIQGTGMNVFSQFFFNTDGSSATGFQAAGWGNSGAEYMLEGGFLYRHSGSGWSWTLQSSSIAHSRNATVIEAAIPLSLLNLSPGSSLSIGFVKNNSSTDRLPLASGALPVFSLAP
ncbi:fibronectin type III domain-containing protein [Paenibacillus sp. strain BS8-2]